MRRCIGGAAPPSPRPPTTQPEKLSLSSQIIINVLSCLPLVLSACLPCCSGGGKGLTGRYKALELLWPFAGPQRHPALPNSYCLILLQTFYTLSLFSITYQQPAMLLQASQWQPPNGRTSWQVTPCMNFARGAEQRPVSNFLISCPPTLGLSCPPIYHTRQSLVHLPGIASPSHSCSKVPLSQMQVGLRTVIPLLMDY